MAFYLSQIANDSIFIYTKLRSNWWDKHIAYSVQIEARSFVD